VPRDRQTDGRIAESLNPPTYGEGIINLLQTTSNLKDVSYSVCLERRYPDRILNYIHFTLHSFNGLLPRTTRISWYQKGKTSLDLTRQEMMGFWDGSGFSWTICKQHAPRSREITTATPHHSIFYRPDALPDAQPTVSKH